MQLTEAIDFCVEAEEYGLDMTNVVVMRSSGWILTGQYGALLANPGTGKAWNHPKICPDHISALLWMMPPSGGRSLTGR